MMLCEECGNHDVHRREIAGVAVLECALCGHLDGSDEEVLAVETFRQAAALGIDPLVYPLARLLGSAPGFKVTGSGGGDVDAGIAPYLQFRIPDGRTLNLERLHTSIQLAEAQTNLPWFLKVATDRHLTFVLAPETRAAPGRRSAGEVRHAQEDLATLTACLDRDMKLRFWQD